MGIKVTGSLDGILQHAGLLEKQARFAASTALTRTAFKGSTLSRIKAKQELNRPTPFTLRGIRYRRASRNRLVSAVWITDKAWSALRWQVLGGTRRFRKRRLVPQPRVRNAAGNLPRGRLKQWRADPRVTSQGGDKNVLVRQTTRTRVLLGFWIRRATYRVRFHWHRHVRKVVDVWLVKEWERAVRHEFRRLKV